MMIKYISQGALFTDLYSLTMMQAYLLQGKNKEVNFDMFIRSTHSNKLGYLVFAGLGSLLDQILTIKFTQDDIDYLKSLKLFRQEFLEYLQSFSFTGNIYSMKEGSVCFPNEPLLCVRAPLIEAQLIEGLILNILNFQTLVATKTARICHAARQKKVIELGLRRAHGPNGAIFASRAAFIGGASASSNVEAGKIFGIPVTGTMAHSWVMSHEHEIDSFQDFAEMYPHNITLLLDTYNTLESGLKNAIQIGNKLKQKGISFSVRLDSGDLDYLSKRVRYALNEAGFREVKIIASNDLDEHIVAQILNNKAPIDIFGLGTQLITGGDFSSLPGVYKLSSSRNSDGTWNAMIKTSNDIHKSSLPSIKQVYRYSSSKQYVSDLICLEDETVKPDEDRLFFHPFDERKKIKLGKTLNCEPLLYPFVEKGKIITKLPKITEIQKSTRENIACLDNTYLRPINPHIYHVSISEKLKSLRDSLLF